MGDSWQTMTRDEARAIYERLGIADIDAALDLLTWDDDAPAREAGHGMTNTFDDFLRQARQAAAEYRNAVAAIDGNRMLSAEGRRDQVAQLDRKYRAAADDVQARFAAWLARETKGNAAQLLDERAADVQRLRGILGDANLIDLWRDDIAGAADDELGAMLAAAAEGFEREALLQLVGREVRRRLNRGGPPSAALYMAQDVVRSMTPASAALDRRRELDEAARRADELDPVAYAQDVAPRVGVGVDAFLGQLLQPAG